MKSNLIFIRITGKDLHIGGIPFARIIVLCQTAPYQERGIFRQGRMFNYYAVGAAGQAAYLRIRYLGIDIYPQIATHDPYGPFQQTIKVGKLIKFSA